MVIGKRIRLTDWGRQYGLDPQSTWRMLNEGRLPAHLQVERIGRLWYVILPDEEPALLTVGYARVSSHEQKPQLEPQANRLWAHAGQNGIKLDRVVSEVASGLNDRRPELRRLLADPKVGYDPGGAPGPAGEVRCGHGGRHVAGSGWQVAGD